MNSTWDIYTNDYENLVRNEKDTQAPMPIGYKEHQSYYEGKVIVDKVISDLCWHSLWTGIAIASYTRHAKSEYLIGPKSHDEVYQSSKILSLYIFLRKIYPREFYSIRNVFFLSI